ncbi:MAG: Metallo-beta-lactamase domain protein [Parcubacteria group bacterium GW2011_GWA2_45_15]|nr:MAG: Metallo-beta-lactamase domain protein [Parcubacteria group bacterium GW2011_GWA2_45_15]
MDFLKRHWREALLSALILSNVFVWVAVYQRHPSNVLSVYFLDVGQGDAIFIDSPTHGRVLIDGGANRKVLSELGKILPFADKRIDVIVETHPDKDHIGGLPEVVSRFEIGMFLEPGVESENTIDDELKKRLAQSKIPELLAKRGMVVNFGDGTKLQILFPLPDQDVSNWETNSASIVARLVYGDKSFLLTGDSPIRIENVLLNLDPSLLDSDVLKAGHHGSRTSTSLPYAEAVSPEYAVISVGKDNTYGHPHQEVLNILETIGAEIVSTVEGGTIKFCNRYFGNIYRIVNIAIWFSSASN